MKRVLLWIIISCCWYASFAQGKPDIAFLLQANRQSGNYALAQSYNIELLERCVADSIYARQNMANLITSYFDLSYLNGNENDAWNIIMPFISKINHSDKLLYPKVYQRLLAEYRGNHRDFRFRTSQWNLEPTLDSEDALRFANDCIPDLGALNPFNAICCLLGVADIYMLSGDVDEAKTVINQIRENYEPALRQNVKIEAYMRLFDEILSGYEQDFETSSQLAIDNISFLEQSGLKNSSEYAATLARLLYYYNSLGEYGKAIEVGQRLRKPDFDHRSCIIPEIYNTGSFAQQFREPTVVRSRLLLAEACYHAGRQEEAKSLVANVLDYALENVLTASLATDNFNDVEMYLDPLVQSAPLYASRLNHDSLAEMVYNSALAYKQLSLYARSLMEKLILAGSNTTAKRVLAKYKEAKIALDNAAPEQVDSVANRIAHLQAQLYNATKAQIKQVNPFNWKSIAYCLREDEAAVEFIAYQDDNGEERYMAAIITKEFTSPQIVQLCNREDLSSVANPYTTNQIFNQIWNKILPLIPGKTEIYFSPAGILHEIAVEYAPCDVKTIDFHRLSSTRQLLSRNQLSKDIDSAILFGGIKYDLNADEREEQMAGVRALRGNIAFRGSNSFEYNSSLTRAGLSYLPGTLTEIDSISRILSSSQSAVQKYSSLAATEEQFKLLSGKNIPVIHIATHGFYIPASTKSRLDTMYSYLNRRLTTEEQTLNRSGLMMTGAVNSVMANGLQDCEDGILTAREISRLDLSQVKLMVLSACQTGLGDVEREGVFGLQRGLKRAGANTLIMSLWKVDDNATQILMTTFYKNLMAGQSINIAFSSAQKHLREIDNGKYDEPVYWAAFILIDEI